MASRSREQSLREELTCAICCELFTEPVMLECMHHFCKGCIQSYWARCPRAAACPQCRREFPGRRFRRHYLLAGLVETVRRCSAEERRRDAQRNLEDALQARRREMEDFLRRKHAVQEDICSLTKVSGELHCKIRAEFTRLHQILEEKERAVLAELGEEEEQSLARLHGDVRRLEEGISELQRDIEHIEQTLSKMEEVSLPEAHGVRRDPACLQPGALSGQPRGPLAVHLLEADAAIHLPRSCYTHLRPRICPPQPDLLQRLDCGDRERQTSAGPPQSPALPAVRECPGLAGVRQRPALLGGVGGQQNQVGPGGGCRGCGPGSEGQAVPRERLLDTSPEEQDRVLCHHHPVGAPGPTAAAPESGGLPGLSRGHRGLLRCWGHVSPLHLPAGLCREILPLLQHLLQ
ncbi:E3 ubiquitin-protein ligase TRIM11-like isoform X3 [Struthio camelus]|uniref:E3 ubiquitin-protein ligase TRIM11-like isoform X3 n=1 Tax=Struthio camelus TaxID=8801 RepID=UPI003603AF74